MTEEAAINGFGKRLNKVELDMREQSVRTERNEEDIQKIFSSMSRLPYWVVGTMLIPSLLILYQILTK